MQTSFFSKKINSASALHSAGGEAVLGWISEKDSSPEEWLSTEKVPQGMVTAQRLPELQEHLDNALIVILGDGQ